MRVHFLRVMAGVSLYEMKKYLKDIKKYLIGFLAAVFMYVAINGFCFFFYPTPKQALPFGATQIQIQQYINGFLPDYSYDLKAKVSENDFQNFIKKIGLDKFYNPENKIYQDEDKKNEWSREAYYKEGYLYYSEGKY
jgi:hypothetical protein